MYEHTQGEHPCGGWGFVSTMLIKLSQHICRTDIVAHLQKRAALFPLSSSSSLVIPSLTPSFPMLGTSIANVNAVSELNHKVLIF